MYVEYFRLEGMPFSIAPDPRFLYLSERHREALAHLLYGLEQGGGFVQLTGEVGTGKTTLCRAFLEQLPSHVDVAFIVNPRLDERGLVAAICDELGVSYENSAGLKELVDVLNAHLLDSHARGRRTVLVVDEAQNLGTGVLEQIRLLTNLETAQEKLLQILLIGQPELKELLDRRDLRQLAQRITARYHLEPLDRDETRAYIAHRLRVAGTAESLFTPAAMAEAWRLTGGVPRLINILCDRALLGAYVEEAPRVDRRILRRAAKEVMPPSRLAGAGYRRRWAWGIAGLAVLVSIAGLMPGTLISWWHVSFTAPGGSSAASTSTSSDVRGRVEREGEDEPPVGEPGVEGTEGVKPGVPDSFLASLDDAGAGAGIQAWSRLFRLWGVGYFLDDAVPPCEQAARQGLRCLTGSGSWAQLLTLDRPALIELRNGHGQVVPAVLESVVANRAVIHLAGRRWEVPVDWLQARWLGRYTLLWKPAVASEILKEGDRGLDVLWLRRRLAVWAPEPESPSDPQFFDAALAERLRRFQAEQGLVADGVAGVRTLIRLNDLEADGGRPVLLTEEG